MSNQIDAVLVVYQNRQHAQTIAQMVRSLNFYCELMPAIKADQAAIDQAPAIINLSDASHLPNEKTFAVAEDDLNSIHLKTEIADFLKATCALTPNWTVEAFAELETARLKEIVGTDEVILALSGGVDSSVVAALLHKAIGKQLTCIFVDTGLMRLNEGDQVMQVFHENMGVNVIRVNAEDRYLAALAGENDPERKRKIIGELFIKIFEEEAQKLSHAKWLAQGTIYPDILESGDHHGASNVIKSHHNVGGLPEDMKFELIEPLKYLFKNEVRELGVSLGLPAEMLYRHPFPGPGLGVRILGEIKKEYADILRVADDIFVQGLRAHGLYDKTSQAFAVFLPVKSVGIKDHKRTYEYTIALRAIETIDFMTARAARLPYEFIEEISTKIILEIPKVTRVVYDVSNKPPATIEWE
ncbi:GMP synthase (glutamine-hydrolyzing) [Wohlfahrtiimonas chitiniclastica]|uniref:glutamine-hydrolyzing GMP synthase n=1 Tax=Wohlfahrtiimonas chitiniclastica TaxID=400946 RepID=UPI000B989D18|nr:glutamine-hydrolyzing GMP synthase [Wohlfahrtiimonas chitiniclastica]OYQ69985.1 GMP synthase (glutamine-hydrolyzing) [Wohlfahrtiimonas chitiniclastica]OYQ74108.1 GMP synthase (glutamine-hydrolyzing) [Wohlfahrtiimonas chitiniclastica]OYQ79720.1 GMP synthase (glutamine-hydrolyzing) [Wohlfahrtiimonas chitiniclastica]OYQ83230.1 GMP synthase (glutamine-hydrolyzing) [Wohlfahrtiimonas chitiniclastica]OYQ84202.1 GMP synthase (glutamine-hydrolyzing) [Wohlfahrtiimonas chitiniclastica]